jgi:hypothetical protein
MPFQDNIDSLFLALFVRGIGPYEPEAVYVLLWGTRAEELRDAEGKWKLQRWMDEIFEIAETKRWKSFGRNDSQRPLVLCIQMRGRTEETWLIIFFNVTRIRPCQALPAASTRLLFHT